MVEFSIFNYPVYHYRNCVVYYNAYKSQHDVYYNDRWIGCTNCIYWRCTVRAIINFFVKNEYVSI